MKGPSAVTDHETKPNRRPAARQAPFCNAGTDAYDFIYRNFDQKPTDVLMPGFFNVHRSELIVGTIIECRLGYPEDGITALRVQIIDSPKYDRDGDVMVSYENRKTGKFTPVRHDGTLAEDKEKAA